MASRFWVGGTGNWDSTTTHWSAVSGGTGGASVPTSADDVFFNASSGAGTVTLSGFRYAKTIICTGYTGTITGNGFLSTYGNITLVAGMTWSATPSWTMFGPATLITAGKTISDLTVDGNGTTTITLGSALTVNYLRIGAATLTTSASNYAITCYDVSCSDASGVLTLNGSTLTITGYDLDIGAGIGGWEGTFNLNTATIIFSGASYNSRLTASGRTFTKVQLTGANSSITVIGANTFTNLTLATPTAVGVTTNYFSANTTITTLVLSGTSVTQRAGLSAATTQNGYADLPTAAAVTLTVGTWTTKQYIDFMSIIGAGATTWSGTSFGNGGQNSLITFPAAKTVYWNLAGNNNTENIGWATTSGGTPSAANFPLVQDTMVFDNASAGTGVIFSSHNFGNISSSARTTAFQLDLSAVSLNVFGSWSTGTGITFVSFNGMNFKGRVGAFQQVTSNGVAFPGIVNIATGGSVLLLDAFVANRLTVLSGTLSATNNVTVDSLEAFTPYARARQIGFGAGTWTITSGSVTISSPATLTTSGTGTISMTYASAKSFDAGVVLSGMTINQGGAGTLRFLGANTFSNITNTYTSATTITFPAGTTTTVANFTASGNSGAALLTVNSSSVGTRATLSKTSGTVTSTYLNIKDSAATGGATWNALASTDSGNNTGWTFIKALGSFISFFF